MYFDMHLGKVSIIYPCFEGDKFFSVFAAYHETLAYLQGHTMAGPQKFLNIIPSVYKTVKLFFLNIFHVYSMSTTTINKGTPYLGVGLQLNLTLWF